MYNAVNEVLLLFNAVWIVVVGYNKWVLKFRAAKENIDTAAQKQLKETKSIAKDKQAAREEATRLAVSMAGNIRAYAGDKGNITLEGEMKYTVAKLNKMGEITAKETMWIIQKKGAGILDGSDFSINVTTAKDLKTAIEAYEKLLPQTKTARGAKKAATSELEGYYGAADEALEKMDGMMGNFEKTAADFVANYHNARNIDDYGHGGKKKPQTPNQ
jgi:hypothetical protein